VVITETGARTCFIPASFELGIDLFGSYSGEIEGSWYEGLNYIDALKTYKDTTNSDAARIALNEGGNGSAYWTRSGNNDRFYKVDYRGSYEMNNVTNSYNNRVRPMLAIDKTKIKQDENNRYYID
jgi:hypothetical protein